MVICIINDNRKAQARKVKLKDAILISAARNGNMRGFTSHGWLVDGKHEAIKV